MKKNRINWRRIIILAFIAFVYFTGVLLITSKPLELADLLAWGLAAFTAITVLLIDGGR